MVKKLFVATSTVVVALAASVGTANAHTVGEPGRPNCHGRRVSHGASGHGLTPKTRAGFLTEAAQQDPGEFGQFLRSRFGNEVSVREYHQFVRLNCTAP